jgi:hypothetical protein
VEENHPFSHSVLFDVIVHGMYHSLHKSRTENVRPSARTARRTRVRAVATVCSSARNKWTQRSQFTGILRNPSQTPTKVAACEIVLGAKLWSSTL